jgi:hypothetical protein
MSNAIENLTPQILANILSVLRESCVLPNLVNNSYSSDAAAQGSTIDINDLDDMTAFDVTPGANPLAGVISDVNSTKKQLVLNKFQAATFVMTDKEIKEVQEGTRPRAIEKAVKALANKINSEIFALYKEVYNVVGTAGVNPFGTSTLEAQQAARVLNSALAPMDERRMVLDPFGYANALGLSVLQKVNESGDSEALRDGTITRALGFDWYQDQQVPTHTLGAPATAAIDANATAGAVSLVLDNASGADLATLPVVGDVFTIAGNTQQYVVTSVTADAPTANETTVGIQPALVANVTDGAVVTFVGSHSTNLAFHREAFAFASRPMMDLETPGSLIQPLVDDVSGLAMRFEIQREWKRTVFSIDCLYGVKAVRPQLAVRIAG